MQVSDVVTSLDRSTLTPVVRVLLQRVDAEVTEWSSSVLHEPVSLTTGGVVRVTGSAVSADGTSFPWSVVLKVVVEAPGLADPTVDQYWKREILAYESGILRELSGTFVAPICYVITYRPNGHVWLWLESIADEYGQETWPIERLELAARHLGRFNGTYQESRLPHTSWLARSFLRSWVSQGVTRVGVRMTALEQIAMLRERSMWDHEVVKMVFPTPPIERLNQLWAKRNRLLTRLDRLPQVLSHLDSTSGNLFIRRAPDGEAQTVAIDWAFVASAGIGEDAGHFASWPVADLAKTLPVRVTDRRIFEAYLAGLKEADWTGEPRQVRFGYCVHAALRWGFRPLVNLLIETQSWPAIASSSRPYPDWLISWATETAAQSQFTLDCGDEAEELGREI